MNTLHADSLVAHIAYELASKFWRQRIGSTAVRAMLAELVRHIGRIAKAMSLAAFLLTLNACAGLGTVNSQDEAQMLAALQASAEAWNRGDLKGHLAIYDSSVTVMTKTGPRPTIGAIEKSFDQTYFVNGKPKQYLRMENITIRGLSEQSALMTGRFVLSGGAEAEQSGWFTLIWVRTAAGWRAVHDHTS